ncbi:6-phosphogluconolactonase [Blastococcus aggregatus]|uniref:6-phosphogluconolactonase n=1 Tax=Blastococcus aggregatus TaxID=38502 RepID=A0A285VKE2_9ACTN|nr:6-phosphogluconolactonase [Blastococcus aggregatus]
MHTATDPEQLAEVVASALTARLAEAQAENRTASLVLTGGGIGTAVLAHLPEVVPLPTREPVDWSAVEVWWSDERFVPADDPQRNELSARQALLELVGVPDQRVHPMPASGVGSMEPEDAAAWYAAQLGAAAPAGRPLPRFDVLLLGVGPEGHVASIFPRSSAARDDRAVVAVRNCPKPPPTRLSMTFSTINTAEEVWILAAGRAKARAVSDALSGADPLSVPAAGVRGTQATRWWLDAAAASELPKGGFSSFGT